VLRVDASADLTPEATSSGHCSLAVVRRASHCLVATTSVVARSTCTCAGSKRWARTSRSPTAM
jgi:hypothetical protein